MTTETENLKILNSDAAKVEGECVPVVLYSHNEDGTIQNKTKTDEAEQLAKTWGKRSLKSLVATFWCDSEEFKKAEFERICKTWNSSRWIFYGPIERTEENKKPHVHVIIAFKSSKLFKTLIKILPSKIYHLGDDKGKQIEVRNFTAAKEYAWKENPDDILEFGTQPNDQGKRTDLKKLYEETNYDINKIIEEHNETYIKYKQGITATCEHFQAKKSTLDWLGLTENEDGEFEDVEFKPTIVHWFYGPTGTGKTLEVKNIIKQKIKNKEIKPTEITRIDNFNNGFAIGDLNTNSKIVIIDEFRGNKLKLGELLQLIDGVNINVKGSKLYIHAEEIFITSCQSPQEAYQNVKSDKVNQLLRRLTEIKNFGPEEDESEDLF